MSLSVAGSSRRRSAGRRNAARNHLEPGSDLLVRQWLSSRHLIVPVVSGGARVLDDDFAACSKPGAFASSGSLHAGAAFVIVSEDRQTFDARQRWEIGDLAR